MAEKFDAIIIGTGQSGPSIAQRMTQEGLKTAIIERKLFGGTRVNVGCIPTKALVASARAAHMARRGPDFGVVIDSAINVDMKAVKARKDGIGGDEIVHAVTDLMYAGAPYTVIQRAMHIHPTVSELIPTMLGDLQPLT